MFVLKFILKLVLIPAWLVLLIIWLPIHLAVGICGAIHGFEKLFMVSLTIMALAFGLWRNAFVFISFTVATFLIVLVGSVFEMLIEEGRHQIGNLIRNI